MTLWHYDCLYVQEPRSAVKCVGHVAGNVHASSSRAAWDHVTKLLLVPGLWVCRVRRGSRWLKRRWYRVGGGGGGGAT